jgi:hypothetical protein
VNTEECAELHIRAAEKHRFWSLAALEE